MPITNAGVTAMLKKILGETQTIFDNANAYIGSGDSTTAFATSQTDLQASTNKLRKGMDASYPQRTGLAVDFRASFGTSEANWAWQEWGVFNAASAGDMLTRKVESLGTKTSAQSWQFTATLTFAAA